MSWLKDKLEEDIKLYGAKQEVFALVEIDTDDVKDYYIDTKHIPNVIEQKSNNLTAIIMKLGEIKSTLQN